MSMIERKRKSERGQSLVEFTVMLVVLMVLVTGIVDASRAFFTYLTMRDAAQEGALYGSTDPCGNPPGQACGCMRICDRIRYTSQSIDDIWDDLTVELELVNNACTGGAIEVRVNYDSFPLTMPFIGTFIGDQSVPISASIIDTILTPTCPNSCAYTYPYVYTCP